MDLSVRYFLVLLLLPWVSYTMKVDMQGSLILGRGVIDALTDYVQVNSVSGRRTMDQMEWDPIALETKSAFICRKINFCKESLAIFFSEYVTTLAKSVKVILEGAINTTLPRVPMVIFREEHMQLLKEIKKLLKTVDTKINENNEQYLMVGLVKKISGKYQGEAINFATKNIEAKPNEIEEVKKKLIQKLVLAIAIVEERYLKTGCSNFKACLRTVEITRALSIVLAGFKDGSDDQAKIFIKAFYEVLFDTPFYSTLSDHTANAFQIILNDMSYSETSTAKDVLMTVSKLVESRQECETNNKDFPGGYDTKLLNMVLSDMDYIYSKHKKDPFHVFLKAFYEWRKTDGRTKYTSLRTDIRSVTTNIEREVVTVSEMIRTKLINEVKVFLEITIDSDSSNK